MPLISSKSYLSGDISRRAAMVLLPRVSLSSSAIISSLVVLSSQTSLTPVSLSISLDPLTPSCFITAPDMPTVTVNSPNRSSTLFSVTGTSITGSAFLISAVLNLKTFSIALALFISSNSLEAAMNLLTSFSLPVTVNLNSSPVPAASISIGISLLTAIPSDGPPTITPLTPAFSIAILISRAGLICKPKVLVTSRLKVASISASVPSASIWSNNALIAPSSSPANINAAGDPSGAVTAAGIGASASAAISSL